MMMNIPFYKFHGAGNDFIMIDNRKSILLTSSKIAQMCAPHTGIGADGLILLEQMPNVDFKMRYFNADGGEASFCGNGGRCAVAFAHYLQIIKKRCRFQAFDGCHQAEILEYAGYKWLVRLEMKKSAPIQIFEDGFFIDTGSPHFVVFCDDVHAVDVEMEGRKLRYDMRFKEGGTNVNFVMPFQEGIFVRTYERGVEAETLSCGTGITASACVYAMQKEKIGDAAIPVYTRGGRFQVELAPDQLWLVGPVELCFCGEKI
ncbi:MAG: diaminopimelate epimerase [Bacteroidales bacterium]|jgi:diaminopimelate epimerase|nr:diaminopimelate epimerase [Bacteroidales bacterium]